MFEMIKGMIRTINQIIDALIEFEYEEALKEIEE
jgi:hypothetical protein